LGTFIDFKDIHIPTNFIFIDWLNEDKKNSVKRQENTIINTFTKMINQKKQKKQPT